MFSKLVQKLRGQPAFPLPASERPLAVIGDVHGCLHLLQELLQKLPPDAQVVLVGDYIDRGEDSQGVLRFLSKHPDLICLRGNHEDMLLNFLADPLRHGSRWLQYGGLQTLASFNIAGVQPNPSPEALENYRDALVLEMGVDLIKFLNELLPCYQSGNVLVAHAGANPAAPPEYQTPSDLIWGHPEFHKTPRKDGIWVAYGHVIQDRPNTSRGRIALDTGAYATGRLTAAYFRPEAEPLFISTNT
ncbi:metallophosphoesterase family protein [Pseudophaeobacter sp.]|uniref:metallophosphoesterase family protein n=1 Tax=Pseudophaeobacter sp. TaxID=1971739 RepID=UPI003299074F